MNECYDQFFPTEFLIDYTEHTSEERFLTYVTFRVLSSAAKEDITLPARLQETLKYPTSADDFSEITDFLSEDFYFSPSLEENSFDPYLLLCAIRITRDESGRGAVCFERLLDALCPQVASTDFDEPNLDFSALLQTEADFYAALYLSFTRHRISFDELLPKFAARYQPALRFTCEDFVLYDFMNEYFGVKNCLSDADFTELIDTLVQATLNYNNSSIEMLAASDAPDLLRGNASQFAGIKRFGSIALTASSPREQTEAMLMGLFRYAAAYELRNNLFDFHLDEDKLITLDNWKENLHWHYVQYSNVYQTALSSFYAACLSRKLVHAEFCQNLKVLGITD